MLKRTLSVAVLAMFTGAAFAQDVLPVQAPVDAPIVKQQYADVQTYVQYDWNKNCLDTCMVNAYPETFAYSKLANNAITITCKYVQFKNPTGELTIQTGGYWTVQATLDNHGNITITKFAGIAKYYGANMKRSEAIAKQRYKYWQAQVYNVAAKLPPVIEETQQITSIRQNRMFEADARRALKQLLAKANYSIKSINF